MLNSILQLFKVNLHYIVVNFFNAIANLCNFILDYLIRICQADIQLFYDNLTNPNSNFYLFINVYLLFKLWR